MWQEQDKRTGPAERSADLDEVVWSILLVVLCFWWLFDWFFAVVAWLIFLVVLFFDWFFGARFWHPTRWEGFSPGGAKEEGWRMISLVFVFESPPSSFFPNPECWALNSMKAIISFLPLNIFFWKISRSWNIHMFECKCGNLFERESVWAPFLALH